MQQSCNELYGNFQPGDPGDLPVIRILSGFKDQLYEQSEIESCSYDFMSKYSLVNAQSQEAAFIIL
jgi:hypothetical protein